MLRRFYEVKALIVFLVLWLPLQAAAQGEGYSTYPSICEGKSAANSKRLVFDDVGLKNKSTTKSAWVTCPYISLFEGDSLGRFIPKDTSYGFSVGVDSPERRTFNCFLKTVNPATAVVESRSIKLRVDGPGGDFHTWRLRNNAELVQRLECKIPPGGYLTSVTTAPN